MANVAFWNENLGEFITPKLRLAWPNVLTARGVKDDPNSIPRFAVKGLVPADADMTVLDAAIAEAAKGEFGAKWKENKKLLLAIGTTKENEGLSAEAEEYPRFVSASAYEDQPPLIYRVEAGKLVLFDGEAKEIYSGRWAMLGVLPRAYNKVSKGVKFALKRVILLRHDDRLAIKGAGPRDSTEGFEGVDLGEGESASSMFD